MKRRILKPTVNIIGAGIGGLCTAAILVKFGFKVRLFEALGQLGGFVHSFNRGGYTFEATTHQIGGLGDIDYLDRTFRALGVDDVALVPHPNFYEVGYLGDDGALSTRYRVPADPREFVDELSRHFPDQRAALEAYIEKVEKISRDILRLKRVQREEMTSEVVGDALSALMLVKGRRGGALQKLGMRSFSHFAESYTRPYSVLLEGIKQPLRNILEQQWFYTATLPSETPAPFMAVLSYVFIFGKPHLVRGGTSRLVEALARQITEKGGEIYKRTPIIKIVIERGKTKGVVTNAGRLFSADCTISNISTARTFLDLVGESELPAQYARAIKALKPSRSAFQVSLGARIRLEDFGLDTATNVFTYTRDVEADYRQSRNGPGERTPFVVTNYSLDDASFAPSGSSSLSMVEFDDYERWTGLSRQDYRKEKQRTQALMVSKLEKATGLPLRRHIDVVFSGTPLTFQRYSSGAQAEIYGPALTMDQALARRTSPVTPIKNLYLVGAFTQPGHGISAIMDSSVIFARRLSRSLRPDLVAKLFPSLNWVPAYPTEELQQP